MRASTFQCGRRRKWTWHCIPRYWARWKKYELDPCFLSRFSSSPTRILFESSPFEIAYLCVIVESKTQVMTLLKTLMHAFSTAIFRPQSDCNFSSSETATPALMEAKVRIQLHINQPWPIYSIRVAITLLEVTLLLLNEVNHELTAHLSYKPEKFTSATQECRKWWFSNLIFFWHIVETTKWTMDMYWFSTNTSIY